MGLEKCNDCLYKFKFNTQKPCLNCSEIDTKPNNKNSEYIKFNVKCATCLYKDINKKEWPCIDCAYIKPFISRYNYPYNYEAGNDKTDELIEKEFNKIKKCDVCVNRHKPINEEPCNNCYENDKPNFEFDISILKKALKDKNEKDTEKMEILLKALKNIKKQDKINTETSKNYDEHYQTEHQPIEVMQANMTHDEFIGYLKGNITKYILRMGRKDDVKKEAAKIRRYAQWLEQVVNGETINPREE